jgi:chromosome partitioning protein
MRIITLASRTSGSGKTLLASHLAVAAGICGVESVALVDLDPAGTLTAWWNRRSAEQPFLADTSVATLAADLVRLEHAGVQLAIVDTPEAAAIPISEGAAVSDLILIPARPTPHDLLAAVGTVDLLGGWGKPVVFVLNGVTATARIGAQSLDSLAQHGPLAPAILHENAETAAAMASGLTAFELPSQSASRREYEALWAYIAERLALGPSSVAAPASEPDVRATQAEAMEHAAIA